MDNQFYRDLLDWFMVSDPWTLDYHAEIRIQKELDKEAIRRGYDGWIEAYHEIKRENNV